MTDFREENWILENLSKDKTSQILQVNFKKFIIVWYTVLSFVVFDKYDMKIHLFNFFTPSRNKQMYRRNAAMQTGNKYLRDADIKNIINYLNRPPIIEHWYVVWDITNNVIFLNLKKNNTQWHLLFVTEALIFLYSIIYY